MTWRWRTWWLAIPSLLGLVATIATTRQGVLFDGDSASYLRSAEILRSEPWRLFALPTTDSVAMPSRFPPLYSFALALSAPDSLALVGARWAGIAFATASLALVTALVRRWAPPITALAVGLLVLVTRGYVLRLHSYVMSDGLFLVLVLVTFTILERASVAPASSRRRASLVALAVLCGSLSTLTRLVGVSVVLTVALAILVASPRQRWLRAAAALVAGVALPVVWWLVQSPKGSVGDRRLDWYGLRPVAGLREMVDTVGLFWLPNQVADGAAAGVVDALVLVGLLGAVAYSAIALRTGVRADATSWGRARAVGLAFVWSYLAVLVASRTVADPFIALEGRHLVVWWIVLMAVVIVDLARAVEQHGRGVPAVAAVSGLVALLLAASPGLARAIEDPLTAGYSVVVSPDVDGLLDLARSRGADGTIYTDRTDLLYLHNGLVAGHVPLERDPATGELIPGFERSVDAMVDDLRRRPGIVLLIGNDYVWSPTPERLVEVGGLSVLARTDEVAALVCDVGCR